MSGATTGRQRFVKVTEADLGSDLDDDEFRLWSLLRLHGFTDEATIYKSVGQLAKGIRKGERQTQRVLAKLRRRGLLASVPNPGRKIGRKLQLTGAPEQPQEQPGTDCRPLSHLTPVGVTSGTQPVSHLTPRSVTFDVATGDTSDTQIRFPVLDDLNRRPEYTTPQEGRAGGGDGDVSVHNHQDQEQTRQLLAWAGKLGASTDGVAWTEWVRRKLETGCPPQIAWSALWETVATASHPRSSRYVDGTVRNWGTRPIYPAPWLAGTAAPLADGQAGPSRFMTVSESRRERFKQTLSQMEDYPLGDDLESEARRRELRKQLTASTTLNDIADDPAPEPAPPAPAPAPPPTPAPEPPTAPEPAAPATATVTTAGTREVAVSAPPTQRRDTLKPPPSQARVAVLDPEAFARLEAQTLEAEVSGSPLARHFRAALEAQRPRQGTPEAARAIPEAQTPREHDPDAQRILEAVGPGCDAGARAQAARLLVEKFGPTDLRPSNTVYSRIVDEVAAGDWPPGQLSRMFGRSQAPDVRRPGAVFVSGFKRARASGPGNFDPAGQLGAALGIS